MIFFPLIRNGARLKQLSQSIDFFSCMAFMLPGSEAAAMVHVHQSMADKSTQEDWRRVSDETLQQMLLDGRLWYTRTADGAR